MNDKMKDLNDGVMRLVEWLDNNWYWMSREDFQNDEKNHAMEVYNAVLYTVEMLGGDWKRDENGKHSVFICGVGGKAKN